MNVTHDRRPTASSAPWIAGADRRRDLLARETFAAVAARPRWFGRRWPLRWSSARLRSTSCCSSTDVGKELSLDQQVRAMEAQGPRHRRADRQRGAVHRLRCRSSTPVATFIIGPLFIAAHRRHPHVMFAMVDGRQRDLQAGLRRPRALGDHLDARRDRVHHARLAGVPPTGVRPPAPTWRLRADARGHDVRLHVLSHYRPVLCLVGSSLWPSVWACCTSAGPVRIAIVLFGIYFVIAAHHRVRHVGFVRSSMMTRKKVIITIVVVVGPRRRRGANIYFRREQGLTVNGRSHSRARSRSARLGVGQGAAEAAGQHLGAADGPGDASRGRGRTARQGRSVPARNRSAPARRPVAARRGLRRRGAVRLVQARVGVEQARGQRSNRRRRASSSSQQNLKRQQDLWKDGLTTREGTRAGAERSDRSRGRPQGPRAGHHGPRSRKSRRANSRSSRSRRAWRRRATT